ncbi:MAG TPA: CdaR family protein [Candidatus Bathyarchaeia archaeon]|nr:CdaR family protein [Candidatus Bathyarchaeia archaeon]
MKRMFRRNLGLKALALGLAILLWWFVAGESNVHVGFAVPLEIRNIPADMAITNKVDRQVDVRLAGPPTLINGLQQNEISAVIDLSGMKEGKEIIPLTERSVEVPSGLRVERIYPPSVEIVLKELVRKTLPVRARIGGTPEVRSRIEKTEVNPPSLEVEALPDELTRLKELDTEVISPDVPEGIFRAKARVNLPEGHAKIVGNPNVLVTIRFRK